MMSRDVHEVCGVARACFDRPWDEKVFADELGRMWAFLRVLRPLPDARIVSFLSFWMVRDEAHVLNVATHPRARRQGYGRLLMEDMVAVARSKGARYATLEVRVSNRAASSLYCGLGFNAIGVRPSYYQEDDEDAWVMMMEL